MKQLKMRYAVEDESKQIVSWITANPNNHFDSSILKYPTLRMLCSYGDEPVCYLPVHKTLMMESIAVNPSASRLDVAQALRDLTKASELIASSESMREIYFIGGHGGVGEMAALNGKHSFEKVILDGKPAEIYRIRL